MVIANLKKDTYIIKWTNSGYNNLSAKIKISPTGAVSCISVLGGTYEGASIPKVSISDSTITGYLI